MKLSILTPAVPSRILAITRLMGEIAQQIGVQPVEHLVFLDNKRRTVGEKRDALLRMARGEYVAYLDDDDDISDDYVAELLQAIEEKPDVVTFKQSATVNGESSTIIFRLGCPNDPFCPGQFTMRNAWHVCAWRRSLAILSHFPATSYGEDWAFAAPLCAIPGLCEVHIPKVLHYYRHSSQTTEAPPPLTQ